MKTKKIISLGLVAAMMASVTGCSGREELDNLNTISSLNSEASVSNNYNLSWTDEQNMVYAQVSSRKLLDLSTLEKCTDNEIQQVINFMNTVDNQLVGKYDVLSYNNLVEKYIVSDMVSDESVVDTYMTDYLLAFFEKTPNYWQRCKTIIRGIDPNSRSIIVDVQYKTIDFAKEVIPDSTIVLGEPNYEIQMRTRYNKWTQILSKRLTNPNDADLPAMESDFERYYGKAEDIIEEQRVLSNTEAIYETGNQHTYTGVINSDAEKTGGTCTVRYILVPNYVLGINLGMTCEHMYITDYKLDNDITASMSMFTKEGYATVTDSVYSLIYSYFTCLDESNFDGLYKLTNNFAALDKYYSDVFDSTYQKHDGFSVSLFDITGTHITCGVTVSTKERARNSNMMFPVYTDKYYMELELIDGMLKVDEMVLLSRTLEGEPAIATDDADLSGFSAQIELNNDDKLAIENLICKFSEIQLLGDTTSDTFSNTVDISISQNQLTSLKENMTMLSGVKKVVFLNNYQQGTSNYASVRCRELYQDETNAIVEAIATYEFILKGGRWYIYNFDVNSSVRLDTTNLNTTGSLCLVSPGKTEAYTSQLKSTMSTSVDEISDTSVSFDHDEYEPQLKTAVKEQGFRKLTGVEVTESIFDTIAMTCDNAMLYSDFNTSLDEIEAAFADNADATAVVQTFRTESANCIAVIFNINESRYLDTELSEVKNTTVSTYDAAIKALEALSDLENCPDSLANVVETGRSLSRRAGK